jgi:Fic family protein
MRHWDEWQQAKTFDVDDTDRRLCRLAMDIQYRCQHHFFGAYARAYFDNMERDVQSNRQRASKYDTNYLKLPREFQASDVAKVYDISEQAAHAQVSRLCRDGFIERIKKGYYRKLKRQLI